MSLTSWASEKQLQRENLYELVHSVCWSLNGAKFFCYSTAKCLPHFWLTGSILDHHLVLNLLCL